MVNSILYSLKQMPLLKRVLPERIYSVRGLKIFANIVWIIWEIASAFLGKLIYFAAMIAGAGTLYPDGLDGKMYLNILFFLTVIGVLLNTYIFNRPGINITQ